MKKYEMSEGKRVPTVRSMLEQVHLAKIDDVHTRNLALHGVLLPDVVVVPQVPRDVLVEQVLGVREVGPLPLLAVGALWAVPPSRWALQMRPPGP